LNEFVFTTSTDYVNAFNAAGVAIQTPQNGDAGETYASQGAIYSVMFKTISGSTFTPPISQLQEIASHELGHGVDAILGFSSQSASSGFDLAMRNDLLELDYIVVGTSDATSTRRLPCNTTPAYTGPFVGITDPVDGTPFCTSGALTNPARWGSKLNHQILRDGSVTGSEGFFKYTGVTFGDLPYPSSGWLEWYAQAFRDVSYLDTGGSGAQFVPNGVVLNKYLRCTAGTTQSNPSGIDGWLSKVYQGQPIVLPAYCSGPIPLWFDGILALPN